MIDPRSYTLEHMEALRSGTRVDWQILERSIFALGLLEALARVGTPMCFKGGSSLMLLLKVVRVSRRNMLMGTEYPPVPEGTMSRASLIWDRGAPSVPDISLLCR